MQEPQQIKLEYRPVAGARCRFQVTTKLQQGVGNINVTTDQSYAVEMVIAQEILEVRGDRTFRARYTIESAVMKMGGLSSPVPHQGREVVVTMKPNGEILESSREFPFSNPTFPEGPLAINAAWKGKSEIIIPITERIPQATPQGTLELEYHYTLESIQTFAGTECAVIRTFLPDTHVSVPPDLEQDLKAQGKVYFAFQQGRLMGFSNESRSLIRKGDTEASSIFSTRMNLLP
ncbi:MAG: hypothetical protein RDV48_23820 [Candidatus Eremiobacteraeota bacterium]|nr:hypothetical protein [Candidatus Eremiobacteraeota bacterium]